MVLTTVHLWTMTQRARSIHLDRRAIWKKERKRIEHKTVANRLANQETLSDFKFYKKLKLSLQSFKINSKQVTILLFCIGRDERGFQTLKLLIPGFAVLETMAFYFLKSVEVLRAYGFQIHQHVPHLLSFSITSSITIHSQISEDDLSFVGLFRPFDKL